MYLTFSNLNSIHWIIKKRYRPLSDFSKTVGPTDRNAVGPTISKYISDRMSGKT